MTATRAAPFLVLVGDDAISREAARQSFVEAVRSRSPDMRESVFDSAVERLPSFLARFITVSMFGETRVFHIRHAEQLDERDLRELAGYLAHEVPDTYLVVEAGGAGGKKGPDGKAARFAAWLKKVRKLAEENPGRYVVEEFVKPRDYETAGWVMGQAPRLLGRTIGKAEAELLVDLAGTDLGALHSELQKLDLHIPAGRPITRADIERVTSAGREVAPFELAQALGEKNLSRALEVVDALFSMSFHAPSAVAALFRHFWALFRIRKFARRFPEDIRSFESAVARRNKTVQDEIGVRLGTAAGLIRGNSPGSVYPMIIKSRIVEQAKSFKEEHLALILRWLYEIDVGTKTGGLELTQESLQVLCCKIVRVAEYAADVDSRGT